MVETVVLGGHYIVLIVEDGCVQCESVCSWAFDLGWPPSSSHRCDLSLSEDRSSSSVQFYEGSFLRVLMDKLSRMLHQVLLSALTNRP